jgi:hypothetical protein
MNHHYVMGPIVCPWCGEEKKQAPHSGLILINGYPSVCPNSGKAPYEYEGISTPIKKHGPFLGKEKILINTL